MCEKNRVIEIQFKENLKNHTYFFCNVSQSTGWYKNATSAQLHRRPICPHLFLLLLPAVVYAANVAALAHMFNQSTYTYVTQGSFCAGRVTYCQVGA